jgi:hypothetical protein
VVTLAVASFGVTACGGSSDVPPPTPAAPPAATAPAQGGTAPVADRSSGGDGSIAVDIEKERVASKRALRTWGKSAERACRKAERRIEPWVKRVLAINFSKKPTAAQVERAGRTILQFAREAEYEYELLRGVALPDQAAAVEAIESFFDKEEEALMLVQRLGIELKKRNDLEGIVTTVKRLDRLEDDYERAGRAVGALSCVDGD